MAIDIVETFSVKAPIDLVWRFLLDPQQVAPCMPGAELDEVVDERTFHGNVKIKVGAITTRYKGKVHLTKVDEAARAIEMTAEGRETGGGTAKGTMFATMRMLDDGATEVVAKASVDLTGKIMQVGRGMIQGVSHQLFLQFVSAVQAHLEPLAAAAPAAAPAGASRATTTAGAAPTGAAAAGPAPMPPPLPRPKVESQAIKILPLVLNVMWTAIVRFFRRLLGRQPA
jgi:carbon monoxide dehydrogenase subunit G